MGGVFIGLCIVCAIISLIMKIAKENRRMKKSESVLKPLLDKTFGECRYDARGCLSPSDTHDIFWDHPTGRDLVEAAYGGTNIRFSMLHFSREERDIDDHEYTVELYLGPWIVVEKENFIENPVIVSPKKHGHVSKKERVLTDDPEFDDHVYAKGDPVEVLKILAPSKREKIGGLIGRHNKLTLVFEKDRIHAVYPVGDYFMPKTGYNTAQLYEMQLKDLLDIINTLIDL